jgi:hypothetical protein
MNAAQYPDKTRITGKRLFQVLHKQLINTAIVTLVNLVRFYTKIGRNYVHLLKSIHLCAQWQGNYLVANCDWCSTLKESI